MFIDNYGLTNSKSGEKNAENALLWTAEHILLEEIKGIKNIHSEARKGRFKQALDKCRVRAGLYHQNPSYALSEPVHPHDRYMSPDQLTAICGMSSKYGWKYHKEIWKEIKRQGLKYDNVEPDEPKRWIHPRDLIFYGYCAGNPIAKLCIVFLALACIVSCMRKKEETSGKLLAWTKCHILKEKSLVMRWTLKACSKLVKSWKEVFCIYFPDSKNPIHQLAVEVYRGK